MLAAVRSGTGAKASRSWADVAENPEVQGIREGPRGQDDYHYAAIVDQLRDAISPADMMWATATSILRISNAKHEQRSLGAGLVRIQFRGIEAGAPPVNSFAIGKNFLESLLRAGEIRIIAGNVFFRAANLVGQPVIERG